MIKITFLTFLACLFTCFVMGQTVQLTHQISGYVKDSTGTTLPGTTVKLVSKTDSLVTATDGTGRFSFEAVSSLRFVLTLQSIGYASLIRRYNLNATTGRRAILDPVILRSNTILIGGVGVTIAAAIKIKEDTVEYNASAYKVRENAPVEDALKKLPGVDVDKDGNVTAQGKSVTKVRVNGKDYFGGDLKTATRNLPADMVQSYQIVDDYGDQANITGVKSGEPEKVLNITIKQNKNFGHFGQMTLGDGRDAIPQKVPIKDENRYVAGVTAFKFNGDQQLSLLANLNNSNTSLFSFGGPPGGGRGGGPGGPPGGNTSASGITTARSIGFNYRDSWGKKITAYGSFSFGDNDVSTLSSTIQQNISIGNTSLNTSTISQQDNKKNFRFSYNIEYRPDTLNYLKIIPTIFYASVITRQTGHSLLALDGTTISDYNFNSYTSTSSPAYGLNILYNHRFSRRGRNFSISGGAGAYHSYEYQNPVYTYLTGKAGVPADQLIHTGSHTDSLGTTLSYLEPLGKTSYVELNYGYHTAHTVADKAADTLNQGGGSIRYDLLSNNYTYSFTTNRLGLNYRVIEKKYNYTLGISGEPATLDGFSPTTSLHTHVTTFNFAPTARYVYNISRNQSLSLNYSAGSVQPAFTVLQPVIDFSNALYPIRGNPDLRPEFNNNLTLRYNKFDFASGNVFFSNINFTQTDNKIVANTVNYPRKYAVDPRLAGTILTNYQNASGFYTGSAFYLFARPWQQRRYTLMFNGNLTYNNNISYISNVDTSNIGVTQKNIAKNLIFTQAVRFRVSITDIIDAELSTSYSINHSSNSISEANINSNFRTINLGINGKNYFLKNWTLSYDYSKLIYQGYKGATNPNILNIYAERRFLKNNAGTFRFSFYDLFNQNTGYSSTQSGSSISQTNSNKLGRYYLLTFSLRLQKFAGKRPDGPGGMHGPGGPGGPGMN